MIREMDKVKKILPQLIIFLIKMAVSCILKNYENGKAIPRVFEVENSQGDAFFKRNLMRNISNFIILLTYR